MTTELDTAVAFKEADARTRSRNGSTAPKPRRLITKDGIKAAKPATHEDVPCDEWEEGTAFRVGPMGFDSHELWELATVGLNADPSGEGLRGIRLLVVGRCMIDEQRARVFTSDKEITDTLGARDARPIVRAFAAVMRLSKDLDAQVEEAAKNSDGAPSEGRSTA